MAKASAGPDQSHADNIPVLNMRTTAEFVDPEERISGGATVGVVYFDKTDSPLLDSAHVFFAEAVAADLEMQIATVDGRYLATFDYQPSVSLKGWVRLNLSLSKPEFLSAYGINDIALLMTNAETGVAYPVRWGEGASTDTVRVYVNTEGARSFFAIYDSEKKRYVSKSCIPASSRSSFKFDQICEVPVTDIVENTIEIIRKRGAGFGTPIKIPVSLPVSEGF
jgi:hypothetical protein